jgi:hypothetical protein
MIYTVRRKSDFDSDLLNNYFSEFYTNPPESVRIASVQNWYLTKHTIYGMSKTFSVSEYGLQQAKQAIKVKGWSVNDPRWLIEISKYLEPDSDKNWEEYLAWKITDLESEIAFLVAPGISSSTWKRFLKGCSIKKSTFKACCQALKLCWEDIIEEPLLESNQKIIGVQAKYTDPKDYVGPIWTQIIPEPQNAGKRHLITINWGSWCWQQVKTLPVDGLLLCYHKRFKDFYPRVVTVSTFLDRYKERVTSVTSMTKIVNTHFIIDHTGQQLNINRGWEETWQEPPNVKTLPSID